MNLHRLYAVQNQLLTLLKHIDKENNISRDYALDWEIIHMSSCARVAQILAMKRDMDPEICAIAASIHDIGRIFSGKQADHARDGYQPAKDFLQKTGVFSAEEIESLAICTKNHSSKEVEGNPLEEVVKDSDILDCYLHGLEIVKEPHKARLKKH